METIKSAQQAEVLRALGDISLITMGASQTTKALTTAARQLYTPTAIHLKEEKERLQRERREQESLTAWKAQTVSLAGVRMTNGQAQEARSLFIENEDLLADRAVAHGYIREEEKDDLKQGVRRKAELEEKTGRGNITATERAELERWDASHLGQMADKITADIHQGQGVAADAELQKPGSSALLRADRGTSRAGSEDVFQSAPKVRREFSAAVAANTTPDAPAPVAPRVAASGLDL